ncbi:hypothetical protein Cgig2_022964 [Carnegiea gigantea]|uniref:AB hydrolase-1 domain-containing protein n=1 Tax=Carnegiea gigantea TaxID=171969 RepID=A0A9Q1KCX5_9CARY|nr:hypothetical protein Cgig2_022964 [Carnegiea gigantea]
MRVQDVIILLLSEMIVPIVLALAVILVGYVYKAIKPPPPKICGSPGGPPVTSPRIKLKGGRHLAYREAGVSKEEAKYKIVIIHGFDSSKDLNLSISQELIEGLKIYLLFFDRAGYGESDPYPKRSVKSEAYDIQELADGLQLGPKLAGVALVCPFVHYWWPCLPSDLSKKALKKLLVQDQWAFRVARYTPWLYCWWMTQKWFPSLSVVSGNPAIFSRSDLEIIKKLSEVPPVGQEKIRQQSVHESLHRDIMVGYGEWEFDPLDLSNPFPNNEGSVHLWQGYEDRIIPFEVNRFISGKLLWIKYHEVPDSGHLVFFDQSKFDSILRALLCG